MANVLRDARIGVRLLGRSPGFTAVAVLTLGLGPLAFSPDQLNTEAHWLLVMGRLKPDMTLQQANPSLEAISRAIETRTSRSRGESLVSVEPFRNDGDVASDDPGDRVLPEIDVPFWQYPSRRVRMAVRTAADPASVQQSIASLVQTIDPDLPMAGVKTMDHLVGSCWFGTASTPCCSGASRSSDFCLPRSASTA
jgi:hypothetical protein